MEAIPKPQAIKAPATSAMINQLWTPKWPPPLCLQSRSPLPRPGPAKLGSSLPCLLLLITFHSKFFVRVHLTGKIPFSSDTLPARHEGQAASSFQPLQVRKVCKKGAGLITSQSAVHTNPLVTDFPGHHDCSLFTLFDQNGLLAGALHCVSVLK